MSDGVDRNALAPLQEPGAQVCADDGSKRTPPSTPPAILRPLERWGFAGVWTRVAGAAEESRIAVSILASDARMPAAAIALILEDRREDG
jgi:hypothetical protein